MAKAITTLPAAEDIAAMSSLDELDAVAALLPRKAFPSVKYAGTVVPAIDSAVDPATKEAQALAYAAVQHCGLVNSSAALRFGFHHPRAVRQAKYAWSDALGVDLRQHRGPRAVAAVADPETPAEPEAPATEPEAPATEPEAPTEEPKAKVRSSRRPPAKKQAAKAKANEEAMAS
jgi:hypothetical protein